jgi:F-type H+-transporting ATPase subunit b
VLADSGLLTFNATLVVQLVIFLVVAFVIYRLAWGPIVQNIERRNARIEQGLRAAEEAEKRLTSAAAEVQKELEVARQQAREILVRAHQEAVAEAEEVRTRSRREAEAQVEKARADIEAERDRAVQELRAQVGSLVVEATSRVLGKTIDEAAHCRLIDESIAEVSKS